MSEKIKVCVENLTNPSCTLSVRQKKQEIHKMLQNPRVRRCLHKARPHSIYMKCMLIPIRLRSVQLLYWECKFISFVKTRDTKLFSKLKAGR